MDEDRADEDHRPLVGRVARQLLVDDRLVGLEAVDDHLARLREGEALLVLAPADVGQLGAVGGFGRRVYGQHVPLVHPTHAQVEQLHALGLGDALGEQRHVPAGDRRQRGHALEALPLAEVVVALAREHREEGQRQHVVDQVDVAVEDDLQVGDDAHLLGDPGQQPHRAVEQASVLARVGRPPRLVAGLQLLELGEVPPFGEDEPLPLAVLVEEALGREEPVVLIQRAPVDDAVSPRPVLLVGLVGGGVPAVAVPAGVQVDLVIIASRTCHVAPLYY